ncbi:vasculin-like protein 1 isoform X2 [Ixodes scapularis]|uniref:vasculin-like protein 1 isoform X2 n=1 Tax=Ixodes scapularis TaxID=6945 RepID=UPI001A9D6C80|nr:vasculin-like protein 1 isoform X2 [Ixodes scapularis]
MANNNIPAHDFAPSWLKIPSYDTANPQHSDSLHGNQREEHRSSFHRRVGGATRPVFRERDGPPPVLHPGGDRGVAHAPSGEEDLRLGPPALLGPPQGTATAPDKGLVSRRPHSRHDFRDLPQPAYHKLSPASNSSNHSAYPVGHVSGGGLGPGGSKKDLAGNNFNQEFPTLLGADQAPPQPPVVTSVWENPRNSKVHGTVLKKVHLVQRPLRNDSATLEARSKSPSSGVSSVVSAGTLSPKLARHPVVAVAPTSKAMPPSAQSSLYRALGPPAKKIQHVVQQQQQPAGGMHTMEVLVKHPKAKGNKGDFLKALRCGEDPKEGAKGAGDSPLLLNDVCPGNGQCHPQEEEEERSRAELEAASGVRRLSLGDPAAAERAPLSSSLEAEQRLLREMGWKEEASDDDAYAPLTEDELREFQYLTKMRQEKQRNGVQRTVAVTAASDKTGGLLWSPRRVASAAQPFATPPVVNLPQADNGWSSSSDTDSDGN